MATASELAGALLQHAVLDGKRIAEGRHRLAHGLVVRRERFCRNALVPDLADAGAFPADQVESGLGGAGRSKRGQAKAGRGAKGGNSTHDNDISSWKKMF